MARVVGDIAVRVGADIGPLQRGLRRGSGEIDDFANRSKRMAKTVAKAGLAITAAVGTIAAGTYSIVKSAADAGAEIEQLSRLVGLTPEKFQKMAAGAKSVGIEQDKLADILKDVNDRVGDFIQTGGGPMADFFENIAPKVGVTAEQFKKLNSADALQLFVTSLEQANLSQAEMTFYMEAMASDLTALYPLLKNGGEEMGRLGQAAQDAGRILSNDAVNGSTELKRELEGLTSAIKTQLTQAILDNKDEILNTWIPATVTVIESIGKIVTAISSVVDGINTMIEAYERFKRAADGTQFEALPNPADEERRRREDQEAFGRTPGYGGTGGMTRTDDPELQDLILEGLRGGNDIDGGQMNFLPTDDEFEADRERLEGHLGEILEIISTNNDSRIQMLRDARGRELEIEEVTQERRRQIFQGSLSAISSIFDSFASMQDAQNKKEFERQKKLRKASAVISGIASAVAAWEKGMQTGGPGLAAAYTAASLARTGAMISQIDSSSYSGGGASASSGASSAAAPAIPTQTVAINLQGDTFSRSSVEGLLEQIQSQLDRGGRLVFQ